MRGVYYKDYKGERIVKAALLPLDLDSLTQ